MPVVEGLNRYEWDMRYPDAVSFPGMNYWAASSRGPIAVPGAFTEKLTVGGNVADLQKQLDLSLQLRDKVTQTNEAVIQIRDRRKQIWELVARASAAKDVVEAGKELYQTEIQSSEDPLNDPIRLNNKLAALLGVVQSSDTGPTAQSNQVLQTWRGR